MMNVPYDVLNVAAQVTAERMLDSLVIGLALAVFAWALLRLLPRSNPATRFAVWFTAFLATALLTFLNGHRGLLGSMTAVPTLISAPASWAFYAAAAWCVMAGIALLRVIIGLIELRRLRRGCRPVVNPHPEWQAALDRLCPSRRIAILTSDRIDVPVAFGFVHPAIVIPAELLQQLSAAELNHVLLHEAAHLRRWDDWTNVAQKIVKALLVFHPAAWWMEQRISLEREMACDDAVLAETGSPRAYAECLTTLAERSFLRRSVALAQAAVNRIRQTTARVARILDANRPQPAPAHKSAAAVVAVFACACLGITTQLPQLVSFRDAPPGLASVPKPKIASVAASTQAGSVEPEVPPAIVKRGSAAPAIMAKAVVARRRRAVNAVYSDRVEIADRQMHQARVIATKVTATERAVTTAATRYNPALRPIEGVLIIVIDDPVFGPTPVVFHFAVWPSAPSHNAHATPQKTI